MLVLSSRKWKIKLNREDIEFLYIKGKVKLVSKASLWKSNEESLDKRS